MSQALKWIIWIRLFWSLIQAVLKSELIFLKPTELSFLKLEEGSL